MDEQSDCAALCAEVGLDPELVCCDACHADAAAGDEAGPLEPLPAVVLADGRVVRICCTVEGELIDRGLVGE
jgi:hypothetical protein